MRYKVKYLSCWFASRVVTLSTFVPLSVNSAKGLKRWVWRCFAALSMTARGFVMLSAAKHLWRTYGESPVSFQFDVTMVRELETIRKALFYGHSYERDPR